MNDKPLPDPRVALYRQLICRRGRCCIRLRMWSGYATAATQTTM